MTSRPRLDTIRFLTLDEIGRLLAAARGKSRDRALFLLAYRQPSRTTRRSTSSATANRWSGPK